MGGSVVGAADSVVVVAGAVVAVVEVAPAVVGAAVVDAGSSSEVQAVASRIVATRRIDQRFTTTSRFVSFTLRHIVWLY